MSDGTKLAFRRRRAQVKFGAEARCLEPYGILSLRDMLSLGAWRMGLGCLGEILPTAAAAVVLALEIETPKSNAQK